MDTYTYTPIRYAGTAVHVKGRGDGVLIKTTRGARPYHVEVDGTLWRCAEQHLSEIEDVDRKTALETAYRDARRDAWHTFVLGSTVRLNDRPGTYVVIDVPKDGRVNCAKLGGDGNRYVKALLTNLELVEL